MALELRFTLPGQAERAVPLDQSHVKIGALLSNQIVLRAPGVDPIHALIEEADGGGHFLVTDLGSATGVKVNGQLIDVESRLNEGDQIAIGSVVITVAAVPAREIGAGVPLVAPIPGEAQTRAAVGGAAGAAVPEGRTVRVPPGEQVQRREAASATAVSPSDTVANNEPQERKKDLLFSPRKARPSGDVLEVVAYWGDTVLDVELFHPTYKGYERVTVGDPTKSHLIAAGKDHFESHTLAAISSNGFKLNLRSGMQARLRKGGKVEKVDSGGSVSLGSRDIAHIKYGAVSYFMMFVRPPSLNLPKSGPADPLFLGLMLVASLLYFVLVPAAILHQPSGKKDGKDDDIWQVVQVPEKDKLPEKEKQKEVKPPEPKKPPQKVADKKTPPTKPPKPEPKKDIKPAQVVEKEKPKQVKPVEKPVEKPQVQQQLAQNQAKPTPPTPTPQKPKDDSPAKDNNAKAGPKSPNNAQGPGMPSTGAKSPDFKMAGPTLPNTALGKSGGVLGSGMNQTGGAIKGTGKADYKGVEGVNNNKASGVNLSKLGLGVGKVLSTTGAGAINTNFTSGAGGAGGGMGSASKTYGMGGVGSGKSLGLAGAGGAVNNFGSGSGGFLSGQGGSGGAGGSGLGGAFGGGGGNGQGAGGHGRANVTVPPGDPVVSGGLTAQEIMAVIRANLNQIRHCYEQLLQRSPNAAGKMATTFIISTDGRVQTVSVGASTISDSVMRGCVTGKIQRWAFPKPRGGAPVTVNYPFVFNPL